MNKHRIFLGFLLAVLSGSLLANITLPRLISDGAILQRDVELTLWGYADAGEEVVLSFRQNQYRTTTTTNGKWSLTIPAQPAGGPFEMRFQGNNEIVLRDVLFGDVWLCSGQSNMELTMDRLRDAYTRVLAEANNPQIRQFLVPDVYDFNAPHEDLEAGEWQSVSPATIRNFSGTAYFFAVELYAKNKVPIGLINSAVGGSPVEAWMSEQSLRAFPEPYTEMQRFKSDSLIEAITLQDQSRQAKWASTLEEADAGLTGKTPWYADELDDRDWSTMQVPGYWDTGRLGEVHGAVWFRYEVEVPARMVGKPASLWLGTLIDKDEAYVNGIFVGTTGYRYPPRKYPVAAGLLREGTNSICVRLTSKGGRGGFIPDKPYFLATAGDTIDLKGEWKYQLGAAMPPQEGSTFIRWKPGGLYNKMIAPLTRTAIKGVIWYQGESNVGDGAAYAKTFSTMIRDWRTTWQLGDFPFLFVQLCAYQQETFFPVASDWAELRQAQFKTLSVPNTGMVVTIDISEWNDIHPLNKRDVGKRLAAQAFRLAYGDSLVAVSPVPLTHEVAGGKVVVTFSDGSLKTRDGKPLATFEVSGDGKTFFNAKAKIEGAIVTVWSDAVAHPVAVRYAWSDSPGRANLVNGAGLPVTPFEVGGVSERNNATE